MQELEALLKQHDNNIEFDHLNNWIRCYLHIINICSSHIIASSTHISKQYLEALKSESDGNLVYSNIDDNDNHLFAQETDIPELTLNKEQLDIFDDEARALYIGLKCDPIKRARRIVR